MWFLWLMIALALVGFLVGTARFARWSHQQRERKEALVEEAKRRVGRLSSTISVGSFAFDRRRLIEGYIGKPTEHWNPQSFRQLEMLLGDSPVSVEPITWLDGPDHRITAQRFESSKDVELDDPGHYVATFSCDECGRNDYASDDLHVVQETNRAPDLRHRGSYKIRWHVKCPEGHSLLEPQMAIIN